MNRTPPSLLISALLWVLALRYGALSAEVPVETSAQRSATTATEALAYQALEEAERLKASGEWKRAILHYERAYRGLQERSILKRIATLSRQAPLSCERQLQLWRALGERCSSGGCPEIWRVTEELNATVERCEVRLDLRLPPERSLRHNGASQVDHTPPVKVALDDELRGELPLSTLTSAGRHTVALFQGGQKIYEGELTLQEAKPIQTLLLKGTPGALTLGPPQALSSPPHAKTGRQTQRQTQRQRRSKRPRSERSRPKRLRSRGRRASDPLSVSEAKTPTSSPTPAQGAVGQKLVKRGTTTLSGVSADGDARAPMNPARSRPPLKLEAALQCQYEFRGSRALYPDCDGASLKSGDQLRLILKSSENVYLYLFLHNDNGELAVLFPVPGVSNLAKAGVEYVLPGEGWYELDDRGGVTERLQLVASRVRVHAFERARGLKLSPQLLDQLKQTALRGVVKRGPPAQLSERLQEADRVLTTLGDAQVASVRFSIDHLP